MGCNESSADSHALNTSNQKQAKREIKQSQSIPLKKEKAKAQSKAPKVKGIKKQWPIDQAKFNKLPEKIKALYRKAQEMGSFEDQQFPPNRSSLGGPQFEAQIQPLLSKLVWLRPAQFLDPNFTLFDGIDPDDILQGQLGTCYCLATIAVYARTPQKVLQIFPFYDIQLGFYVLRFYTNGKPNYVVVDDYIPCNSSKNFPLFTRPKGNEIWVQLIEKAWAKLIGSYLGAEGMDPTYFMEDLTGCPAYGISFKEKEYNIDQIIGCPSTYMIVLSSKNDIQAEGIVSGHAYSLLQIIEHNDASIFKIRNPWGAFQWNGQYGDQSSLWTQQLIQKCGQDNGDDGIFFISEAQLFDLFQYYTIGFDEPDYKYTYVEFRSQPEEQLYFKFELTQQQNMAIKVAQPFNRMIKDQQYQYSPLAFELGILENDSVTLLDQGAMSSFTGAKSVYSTNDIYTDSEPGEYFIRIKMEWANPKKYNSAVLSVYCAETVTLERLKQPEEMAYTFMQDAQLIDLDDNISYATKWTKGQMICYAVIRQTGAKSNYKVKWTFNSKNFKNCKLAINKLNENVIEFKIDKKEGYNFGTLVNITLAESCDFGTMQIQAQRI